MECCWTRLHFSSPLCFRRSTGATTPSPSLPPSHRPVQEMVWCSGRCVWPILTEVSLIYKKMKWDLNWKNRAALIFCFWIPGFFKVLSQLTQTGDVTPEQFASKLLYFYLCINQKDDYKMFKTLCRVFLFVLRFRICWHQNQGTQFSLARYFCTLTFIYLNI